MNIKLDCNHILFKDLKPGETFMTDYLDVRHYYIKINILQHTFLYVDRPLINIDNSIDLENGNFQCFRDNDIVIKTKGTFYYSFNEE